MHDVVTLFDLLACPACKSDLEVAPSKLQCTACRRTYPIENGVPILKIDPAPAAPHEGHLTRVEGYSAWRHRVILQSLLDHHIVVDVGAGDQVLDDPCIIRTDVHRTPWVDVVADVQALPFKDASVDYVLGCAVMEHLPQPFEAAGEMWRILRPGGYVYADCNFVYPYHGVPGHYFNASPQGLRQLFARFEQLSAGVAPFQRPSFAIEMILATYRQLFRPTTPEEVRFQHLLDFVTWQPLRDYDERLDPEGVFRVAAGSYFAGIKQVTGSDAIIPPPILDAWASSAELQRRFPRPLDVSEPDNLLRWARDEGQATQPAIRAWLESATPFSKRPGGRVDRTVVRAWPVELMTRPEPTELDAVRADLRKRQRPIWKKAVDAGREGGLRALAGRTASYLRWLFLKWRGERY